MGFRRPVQAQALPQICPQPGPQAAFFRSSADIVLYGGAAGGGKSWALLANALLYSNIERFSATIFRRTLAEIKATGGLIDQAKSLFFPYGAKFTQNPLRFTFPSGAVVEFRHLDGPDSQKSIQGAEICYIGIDEAGQTSEADFWYAVGRNRSTCGAKAHIRLSCNPDPDCFLRKLVDWWIEKDPDSPNYGLAIPERSGIVRYFTKDPTSKDLVWFSEAEYDAGCETYGKHMLKSFTFIPAKTCDNPILLKLNPDYEANLALQDESVRRQLQEGNWLVRSVKNSIIDPDQFVVHADNREIPHRFDRMLRSWDFAATEGGGDWTVGQLWGLRGPNLWLLGQVRGQWGTKHRNEQIRNTIQADFSVWNGLVEQWGETQPAAAGPQFTLALNDLCRAACGVDMKWLPTGGRDKIVRSEMFRAALAEGRCHVGTHSWFKEYAARMKGFPASSVPDDEVDTSSNAARILYFKVSTAPRSWVSNSSREAVTVRRKLKVRPIAKVYSN